MILTINGGSSTIKFALYQTDPSLQAVRRGKITGFPGANWLEKEISSDVKAIGHRVVHGMEITRPTLVDDALLQRLKAIIPYDPDHLPGEIELIEAFRSRYPPIPQVVCFDTAFHSDLPRVARLLPIPRRFDKAGIRRYGFHGLSCTYLMEKLVDIGGPALAGSRVILAHLGSGASITAVRNGKSIDTSMGFTPTGGLPMGTRTGDLDPGVMGYMIRQEGVARFGDLVNHESGLLGISETSADMQDLLQRESSDIRAAEAVALFCYQVKKWIGAFSAALGGLDALVFSGGIGENAPPIRSRICAGLEYLGVELSEIQNGQNEVFIAAENSRVPVYVIPTDEELVIARSTENLLRLNSLIK